MSSAAKTLFTVDEFLVHTEKLEGRWELYAGDAVAMAPERVGHLRVKRGAFVALTAAVARANVRCEVFPDGATVRIDTRSAFEPDVLVRCSRAQLPNDALETPDPLIVLEVVSPSTATRDRTLKVEGYFSVPTIIHYLIVEPEVRKIVHFRRDDDGRLGTRIYGEGIIHLDPPGVELPVAEVFGPAADEE